MGLGFFLTWRPMPDRPRALPISDIPSLSVKSDGTVDNQFLVSTVNAIKDKLLQIATLVRGNRAHWGMHARKTIDASGNQVATLTIGSGQITVTQGFHLVDTQNTTDTTDDLDIISGGTNGDFLLLKAANTSRSIVIKDGSSIRGTGDFTLDDVADNYFLVHISGVGTASVWDRVSDSNNA